MAVRGRKIAHYAAGGGALDATAQGLPPATGALGNSPPGPSSNAAGSWGAAAESGGVQGDPNISPVGASNAWAGYDPGNPEQNVGGKWLPTQAAAPAAAPDVFAPAQPVPAAPAPGSNIIGMAAGSFPSAVNNGPGGDEGSIGFKKGGPVEGAIPTEHFAGGGRSGHGGYHIPGTPQPIPDPYQQQASAPGRSAQLVGTSIKPEYDIGGQGMPSGGPGTSQASLDPSDESGGTPNFKSNMPSMQSGGQQANKMASQANEQSQQGSGSSWGGGLDSLPPAEDAGGPAGAGEEAGGAGALDAGGGMGAAVAGAGTALAEGGKVDRKPVNRDPGDPMNMDPDQPPTNKEGQYVGMAPHEETETTTGQPVGPGTSFGVASGGAIPDTADIPLDQDQGQEGQAGDLYAQVKNVLSQTRKSFGLTDSAFKMAADPQFPGLAVEPTEGGKAPELVEDPTMTVAGNEAQNTGGEQNPGSMPMAEGGAIPDERSDAAINDSPPYSYPGESLKRPKLPTQRKTDTYGPNYVTGPGTPPMGFR